MQKKASARTDYFTDLHPLWVPLAALSSVRGLLQVSAIDCSPVRFHTTPNPQILPNSISQLDLPGGGALQLRILLQY